MPLDSKPAPISLPAFSAPKPLASITRVVERAKALQDVFADNPAEGAEVLQVALSHLASNKDRIAAWLILRYALTEDEAVADAAWLNDLLTRL